jgi:hypothetical protein
MKEIPLTKGKVALVDDADYEWLMQWNWYAWFSPRSKTWYARRSNGDQKLYMHREILRAGQGVTVDHADHQTLNNQRYNLRSCSQSLNMANQVISSANSSGFKGVCWDSNRGRWHCGIMVNKRKKNIGRFSSVTDAARAYDAAAVEIFGEFALTNSKLGLL